jgi:glycosyltransferase involved in cell wall biosynthesis
VIGKTLRSLQFGMHWFPERQGGLDRVYYELSLALPGAGVAFDGLVAGTGRSAQDTDGAVQAFSPANVSMPQRWLGMRRSFIKYLNTHEPDLLVSHFALYTLPILDKLGSRKLLVHFHGPWADESSVEGNSNLRNSIKRKTENLVYRRATRAIVLSKAFAELFAEKYNYPRDRIHIIPGGIDTKRFAVTESREAARERLGWPAARPTIVAVRRLVPRMGLENLLAAVEIIKRDIPDILLIIAGRGWRQPYLAEQILKSGLSDNVLLIGFVSEENLPYVYRAADLSIVPTVALEGFGLIAAESLAAGTPCLVSPVGGLPEVVTGLSPNLVLRSPAIGDIAEAISSALQGKLILPDEASCRAYAEKNFDWHIIAAKTAEVYRLAVQ